MTDTELDKVHEAIAHYNELMDQPHEKDDRLGRIEPLSVGDVWIGAAEGCSCECDLCGVEISTSPVGELEEVQHYTILPVKHAQEPERPYMPGYDPDLCGDCAEYVRTMKISRPLRT